MKKLIEQALFVCALFVVCFTCCVSTTNASQAVAADTNKPKVALVLMRSTEITYLKFLDVFQEELQFADKEKNLTVSSGDDVDELYDDYCFNNGLNPAHNPTQDFLISFVKSSPYDRVLFVRVNDIKADVNKTNEAGSFGMVSKAVTYVGLTTQATLVDKEKVLKTYTVSADNKSRVDPIEVALGVFKQCLKKTYKEFKPVIFNAEVK